MKVLLSIKPEFVEKIFSGEKKYEYRKSIFKKTDIDTIVIYSTKPVGKIVGEIKIDCILDESIEDLWNKTHQDSGISYEFFKSYFQKKERGYAIKIRETKKYKKPLSPVEIFSNFHPPQSFCYIE